MVEKLMIQKGNRNNDLNQYIRKNQVSVYIYIYIMK